MIVNQLEYMQEKEKGYDTDNVLMLGLRGQYISENAEVLKEKVRSKQKKHLYAFELLLSPIKRFGTTV